jgi:tryptophanyl-tRNA synthetase
LTDQERKRLFSGVQPSGKLHIGNYVGALSQWVEQQDVYESLFSIVDLHALTLPESVESGRLREKSREMAALCLACGIDPRRSTLFIQSHVPEITELAWVLNCITPVSWLERMTQYKSKAGQTRSVGAGLLNYPVLQAADILIFKTHVVPVGEDQRQHVELARDIAARFNALFSPVFVEPQALIRADGARIRALDDPGSKMSKSLGESRPGHSIGLLDDPNTIRQAIKAAVTDSGRETNLQRASPGVRNLLTLYAAVTGAPVEALDFLFGGKGYGDLKDAVAEAVIQALQPIQERYQEITSDPGTIESVLETGAARAHDLARRTMAEVRRVTGIG